MEQLHESLKQLEKEKAVMYEDWIKQLNELKLEVESKRRQLEARQMDVESVVAMVILPCFWISNNNNLLCTMLYHCLKFSLFVYQQVDDNTSKTNQVKQSGEAKVKQLAAKYEEIVKQVSFFSFPLFAAELPREFCQT